MVKVTTKNGAAYCIDSTEVTNDDYLAFINSKPSLDGQPPECDFNKSYLPHPNIPEPWPKSGRENYPIHWIDWCDARAYCAFAGKRLCGLVGGQANPQNDLDPEKNEWMNACTHQGDSLYPYGPGLVPGACNVGSVSLDDKSAPVGSFPKCEGGFPGLFDMVGNVSEFVDNCSGGSCETMGPSFFNSGDTCAPSGVVDLIKAGGSIFGVRCCKDSD